MVYPTEKIFGGVVWLVAITTSQLDLELSWFSWLIMPFRWIETQLLWFLHVNTSTTFRMFLSASATKFGRSVVPYATPYGIAMTTNALALALLWFIPYFAAADDRTRAFGDFLRPVTSRNKSAHYFIVCARVWFVTSWINAALAQYMTDGGTFRVVLRAVCSCLIL